MHSTNSNKPPVSQQQEKQQRRVRTQHSTQLAQPATMEVTRQSPRRQAKSSHDAYTAWTRPFSEKEVSDQHTDEAKERSLHAPISVLFRENVCEEII
jgi:hypothetical protein